MELFDVENLTGTHLVFFHIIVVLMTTLNHNFLKKESYVDLQFNDP